MRIAKRRKYRAAKNRNLIICDEAHLLFGAFDSVNVLSKMAMFTRKASFPARQMIATQAMMKFNSGKRVRFLGSARWEDTGEAIKPAPKKFVPAQAVRRARESSLDELAVEAQKLGMYK